MAFSLGRGPMQISAAVQSCVLQCLFLTKYKLVYYSILILSYCTDQEELGLMAWYKF